jgi:uncharacterized protein (DUF2147 family)
MKKLFLTVALMLTSVSAQAGNSFSFNVGGHDVHVRIPGNCRELSCIAVSVPGFKGLNSRDDDEPAPAPAANAPATPAPAAPAPAQTAVTPVSAPVAAAATTVLPVSAPAASTPPASSATTPPPAPTTVASAEPAQAPAAPPPAAIQAANTPVGLWMTEKNEGKVRIEPCGANLCGYAVNARTNANGERVLIDMKPRENKWAGRIHDTRGGGTYDSTIAMRGDNKLRVQGCAFGGMFCGGQTWTRLP